MDNGFDCMGEEWRREEENSQIIFYLIFIWHIETIKVKRIIKSDFESINLVQSVFSSSWFDFISYINN